MQTFYKNQLEYPKIKKIFAYERVIAVCLLNICSLEGVLAPTWKVQHVGPVANNKNIE